MSTKIELQQDKATDGALPKDETSEVESKGTGFTKKWFKTFQLWKQCHESGSFPDDETNRRVKVSERNVQDQNRSKKIESCYSPLTDKKVQLLIASGFEFRETIDQRLVHYESFKDRQLNIRKGDKIVALEGPLKNWYYDQRHLFSKPEDSLNRTDLEQQQKLISAGYVNLESMNVDEEFVRDLNEMKLWLNEKEE